MSLSEPNSHQSSNHPQIPSHPVISNTSLIQAIENIDSFDENWPKQIKAKVVSALKARFPVDSEITIQNIGSLGSELDANIVSNVERVFERLVKKQQKQGSDDSSFNMNRQSDSDLSSSHEDIDKDKSQQENEQNVQQKNYQEKEQKQV